MSGSGNIQGTEYQHRVIAYVAAHVIAERRLGWITADDTPIGLSVETEGPGDDLAIEFGTQRLEVQVKHGLDKRGLVSFLRGLDASDEHVLLVIDPSATEWIRSDLPRDLKRLNSGRSELSAESRILESELGTAAPVLRRVAIHVVDAGNDGAAHSQAAIAQLASVLVDRDAAETAYALLVRDAADRGRNRWRADRHELLKILSAHRIYVRPPTEEERLNAQLDLVLGLHRRRQFHSARSTLDSIRKRATHPLPLSIQYRITHLDAALRLALDDLAGAFDGAMKARDLDPTRPDAYRVAAKAKALSGDLRMALEVAATGRLRAPNDPKLFFVFMQLSAENEQPTPRPPLSIESDFEFRRASAFWAFERQQWSHVLTLTESLVREKREGDLLYLYAEAIQRQQPDDRIAQEAAVRHATEALDDLPDGDFLALRALQVRSRALRKLNEVARANEDEERVRRLDSADPLVLRERAAELLRVGRGREGLELLNHSAIETSILALAFRAFLFVTQGLADQARADLNRLLVRLSEVVANEEASIGIADAAYELGDVEAMDKAFKAFRGIRRNRGAELITRARITLLRGDLAAAEPLFEAAQAEEPLRHSLAELCAQLVDRADSKNAARIARNLELGSTPHPYLMRIARAFYEESDWDRVQAVLDSLKAAPMPMPSWAVRMAAQVAVLRDDSRAAVEALEEIVRRGERVEPAVRLNLAAGLLDLGNEAAARAQIEAASADPALAAPEFIQAIRLLIFLRDDGRALELAFRGFRTWKNDPQLHRLLATLVLRSQLPVPEVVAVNTSVFIEGGTKARWLTIVDDDPDSQRQEIDGSAAERQGLLGMRVGDVVPRRNGVLGRDEKISRIVPRVALEARRVLDNFEHAFADEDFFATSFNVGDLSKPSDFQPFIATLEARKKSVGSLFDGYRKSTFPLSFIADRLGCSVPALMDGMAADATLPLARTEWPDAAGFAESVDAAESAKTIVLTRSAIHTASQLELLPQLGQLPIVATWSLVREVKAEVFEAERLVREGKAVLHSPEDGLRMVEVPPGNEHFRRHLEILQKQLAWLQTVRIVPRAFASLSEEHQSLQVMIGLAANDALDLVTGGERTLYADDLGLRALLVGRGKGRSFSTIALLALLRKRGIIDEGLWIQLLLRILELRQGPLQPDATLVLAALHRFRSDPVKSQTILEITFSTRMTLLEATKLVATLIKRDAGSLQQLGARRLTRLALPTIAKLWPPNRGFCARLLLKEVEDACLLLPKCRDECETAAREFLAQGLLE